MCECVCLSVCECVCECVYECVCECVSVCGVCVLNSRGGQRGHVGTSPNGWSCWYIT